MFDFGLNDEYMRDALDMLLMATADVYTADAADGGRYSHLAHSGLRCVLQPVSRSNTMTSDTRSELDAMGVLYFDPSYTMPERAKLEVSSRPGSRWSINVGTCWPDYGAGGVLVMQHADVTRLAL